MIAPAYSRTTPGLPAYTWNAVDSVLNRLSLVTRLEQIDSWSAAFVGEWSEKLTAELSNPQEGFFVKARLSHLFSELSMCKDLNARLVERKYSFASQAQAASHAAAFLEDTVASLDQLLDEEYYRLDCSLSPPKAGRLRRRFNAQIVALKEEWKRARELLQAIEPTDGPARAIEAVTAAKSATVQAELAALIDWLRLENAGRYYESASMAPGANSMVVPSLQMQS